MLHQTGGHRMSTMVHIKTKYAKQLKNLSFTERNVALQTCSKISSYCRVDMLCDKTNRHVVWCFYCCCKLFLIFQRDSTWSCVKRAEQSQTEKSANIYINPLSFMQTSNLCWTVRLMCLQLHHNLNYSIPSSSQLTDIALRQSTAFQSRGRYLWWAPLAPIRYSPIGTVPSHHSRIPLRCDSGTTCHQINTHTPCGLNG